MKGLNLYVETFKNCLNADNPNQLKRHIKHYKANYESKLFSAGAVVLALGLLGAIAGVAASIAFLPLGLNMISLSCMAILFGLSSMAPSFYAKKTDIELFKNGFAIKNDMAREASTNEENSNHRGLI